MKRRNPFELWRGWRADFVFLTIIVGFFVVFFWPSIFAGKFLIAGDAYYQSYPLRTIAWEAVRAGDFPLWTPYVFSGYPLLSMSQLAIGYPLTWAYLILPAEQAEEIY